MSIFVSGDRAIYRRWVNIIPSALIPGAGQYLSGRRRAGLFWFISFVTYVGLKMFLNFFPFVKTPGIAPYLTICDCVFVVCVCADACRRPILSFGLKRWFELLAVAVAIPLLPFLFLRQLLLQPFYIPTGGMQPTLMGKGTTPDGHEKRGDSIMVDKVTYRFNEPRRGEIVVFKTVGLVAPGLPQNQFFVKRLVGLPGERVSIRPPFLYINGNKVVIPRIFEKIASRSDGFSGYIGTGLLSSDGEEVLLGKDEYLVLGDNSQNSLDGRYFGAIKRKSILGKVAWIYAPIERRGWPE